MECRHQTTVLRVVDFCYIQVMPTQTLAEAIGLNVRRLRQEHELTLESVAIAARQRGLKWDNTRVAHFEAGKVPPNLNTIVALAVALTDCIKTPITLADICSADHPIRVNDLLALGPDTLAQWSAGEPISAPTQLIGPIRLKLPNFPDAIGVRDLEGLDQEAVQEAIAHAGITEERISSSLDITPTALAIWSVRLWGKSFSAERDHRSPDGASAQSRGRISRQLKDELKSEISHGNR